MENEIIKLVATNGAFAGLFVWLLFYTQKQNEIRETKYQDTIDKNQSIIMELTKKFDIVEDVKTDVEDIKNKLERRK